MKKLLFLMIALISFIGCEKTDNQNSEVVTNKIEIPSGDTYLINEIFISYSSTEESFNITLKNDAEKFVIIDLCCFSSANLVEGVYNSVDEKPEENEFDAMFINQNSNNSIHTINDCGVLDVSLDNDLITLNMDNCMTNEGLFSFYYSGTLPEITSL